MVLVLILVPKRASSRIDEVSVGMKIDIAVIAVIVVSMARRA